MHRVDELMGADIEVRLALVHHEVVDACDRGGLMDRLGADSLLPTPDDALSNEG